VTSALADLDILPLSDECPVGGEHYANTESRKNDQGLYEYRVVHQVRDRIGELAPVKQNTEQTGCPDCHKIPCKCRARIRTVFLWSFTKWSCAAISFISLAYGS